MKFTTKTLLILSFTLLLAIAANAQKEWLGIYEFDENGGRTAGGTAIFISHQLRVVETDDGLLGYLQSNGYQTSKDLVCKVKTEGGKLLVYFESYGENNILETFEPGDLLLTLERKTVKDKSEIITYWNKFTPSVPKNEKSGKVYFKKVDQ